MRTYRVLETRPNNLPPIEITYNGFSQHVFDANIVALVFSEGEVDFFGLDRAEDVHELHRYVDNQDDGLEKTVHLYKRIT